MPTPLLNNESPFQKLFREPPNYKSLKTFGTLCYPWLRPYSKNKLEPSSRPCVYLGFSIIYHSHQCFDLKSSKVFLSRDVLFCEDIYPFKTIFSNFHNSTLEWNYSLLNPSSTPTTPHLPTISPLPQLIHVQSHPTPKTRNKRLPSTHSQSNDLGSPPTQRDSSPDVNPLPPISPPIKKAPHPPPSYTLPTSSLLHKIRDKIITRSRHHIPKPKKIFDYLAHADTSSTPTTFKQAHQTQEWRSAMQAEF